tara:strand:+ start:2495 stop:2803 length:309 start_codon:yes stop_codon:yes gene_type:complete
MKSFSTVARELQEAKFKLPKGHKELENDSVKIGGKLVDIVYAMSKGKVHAFVNGQNFTGTSPYKDLKSAKKEFKDIKKIMKNMGEDFDVTIEEIVNEINSRV